MISIWLWSNTVGDELSIPNAADSSDMAGSHDCTSHQAAGYTYLPCPSSSGYPDRLANMLIINGLTVIMMKMIPMLKLGNEWMDGWMLGANDFVIENRIYAIYKMDRFRTGATTHESKVFYLALL